MAEPMHPDVRVLLVDDQPQFRRAAAMLIRATDGLMLAGEAGSGEEAVALARDLRPDLVLMDVRLPGINGPEATRQILAERPRHQGHPGVHLRGGRPAGPRTLRAAPGFLRKQDLDVSELVSRPSGV